MGNCCLTVTDQNKQKNVHLSLFENHSKDEKKISGIQKI